MILRVIFFLWLIIITTLSVIPFPDNSLTISVSDKLLHFTVYFVTTLLLCVAFRKKGVSALFLHSGLVFLYSTAIELVQFFLPHRDVSVGDIVANVSGILSFSFLYLLYLWVSGASRNSRPTRKELRYFDDKRP